MRLNINRQDTPAHYPPTIGLEEIQPEKYGIQTEKELMQYVFTQHSTGLYLIQAKLGERKYWANTWKGEIQVEDREHLLFKADVNYLDQLTYISTEEMPATGVLKRVEIPESLQDLAGEIASVRD